MTEEDAIDPNHPRQREVAKTYSNPAETVASIIANSAAMSRRSGTAKDASFCVNRWAGWINGIGNDFTPEEGGNLLSLRALWESPNFHGDFRPFTHKPWERKSYGQVSDRFPRQDMLPVLEGLIGRRVAPVRQGTVDEINGSYIASLREMYGEEMAESEGVDADGFKFTLHSIPSAIEGVRVQILLGGKYEYVRHDLYPAFSDIALEFTPEALQKVKQFSPEFKKELLTSLEFKTSNKEKTVAYSGPVTDEDLASAGVEVKDGAYFELGTDIPLQEPLVDGWGDKELREWHAGRRSFPPQKKSKSK